MLKLLKIRNFALMEELTIEFDRGLTVVTGETGTGKSMIVEAIATLCGSKMDDVLIRSGKDHAEVTGVFQALPHIVDKLKQSGISVEDALIIRRRIERGKRQSSYINDQIVSINLLKNITREMVDLIGQYENQSLFFAKNHLMLLDSFAGTIKQRNEYADNYSKYQKAHKQLQSLLAKTKEKDDRVDYLKYQIDEIEKADLQPREQEELNAEQELLESSEKRSILSGEIISCLYEEDDSLIERMARVKKAFDELCHYDKNLAELNEKMDSIISSIDDIHRELSSYNSQIEFSQDRLDFVQERLETIKRIQKKYGKTLKEINNYLANLKKDLTTIETHDEEIKKLQEHIRAIEKTMTEQAVQLSKERKQAAALLREKILELLHHLGMKKARFEIRMETKPFDETGRDEAEFFISTNPGEELKPLRKIASGGEISRITLSLKTVLSEADRIPTIIFDEVDTGIGGRIAEAVGTLLARTSKKHQIICITHLPQISVFGENHFLVQKQIKGKETFTSVAQIKGETRKMEIARMLGGKEITRKTMEHAAEFLRKGQQNESGNDQ
jgi:DNA repair protein RecN (Recombination protein N)